MKPYLKIVKKGNKYTGWFCCTELPKGVKEYTYGIEETLPVLARLAAAVAAGKVVSRPEIVETYPCRDGEGKYVKKFKYVSFRKENINVLYGRNLSAQLKKIGF